MRNPVVYFAGQCAKYSKNRLNSRIFWLKNFLISDLDLLVVVMFSVLVAGCYNAGENCTSTTMAYLMSQDFVEKRLKSPSTAEFPYTLSEGVKIMYQGECRHAIFAYVDAQNSFGATVRVKYYAEVQNQKGTDTWLLLDLKMSQ